MDDSIHRDVTLALDAAATGEEGAAARLLPLVYEELRLLAKARMSKTPPGQTLQATALVHEAYLRVVGEHDSRWAGRGHFFFAAARAMRDILVEQARRKSRLKHGGGSKRADVDLDGILIEPPKEDLLALDEALNRLEEEDSEKAGIVMLRYFTGLTTEETAAVLNVSVSTIERKWRVIRAWLRRELDEPRETDGEEGDA